MSKAIRTNHRIEAEISFVLAAVFVFISSITWDDQIDFTVTIKQIILFEFYSPGFLYMNPMGAVVTAQAELYLVFSSLMCEFRGKPLFIPVEHYALVYQSLGQNMNFPEVVGLYFNLE